ncbi:hypothetical protein GGR44_000761 [Sphingobium fontiphilum]|uniref:Uncharacterized protein n=1 Tax=Sphingobium fontiphilum TaxID=944425 RepID=A0A7W6DDB0_9SPHN|nr:hypothetical protein [Sphingobium fontiphilum]MBB3981130.1 hypothetical protein [Sphingobium fontiphilum]
MKAFDGKISIFPSSSSLGCPMPVATISRREGAPGSVPAATPTAPLDLRHRSPVSLHSRGLPRQGFMRYKFTSKTSVSSSIGRLRGAAPSHDRRALPSGILSAQALRQIVAEMID